MGKPRFENGGGEACDQLGMGRGGLGHLWRCLDDLIFDAEEVFQFVNVKVFE